MACSTQPPGAAWRGAPIAALLDQDLERAELQALRQLIDDRLKESK